VGAQQAGGVVYQLAEKNRALSAQAQSACIGHRLSKNRLHLGTKIISETGWIQPLAESIDPYRQASRNSRDITPV
jgi:hypothetical protein